MTKRLLAAILLLGIACDGSDSRQAAQDDAPNAETQERREQDHGTPDHGTPDRGMPIVARLIESPPPRPFELRSLQRQGGEKVWSFSSEPGPRGAGWKARSADLEDRRVVAGRLLKSSGAYQTIERTVDFEAGQFDTIELSTDRTKGAAFTLHWAGPDQEFSGKRSLRVPSNDIVRHQFQRILFDLRDHPRWQGRIHKLRLAIGAPTDQRILLRELTATKKKLDPEALAASLGKSWLVDRAGDVRSAWLAVPDLAVERPVAKLPRRARLRGSWSVPEGYPKSTRVSISWQADGKASQPLFEHSLGDGKAGRWQPLEMDLQRWAGLSGVMSFKVTGVPKEIVETLGPAAWGSPEIFSAEAEKRPPNVVLISIDTLRADRLSTYGYELPTTPKLEAWAARAGTVFVNTIAQAPWTLPSHASMLTGLDPFQHGTNHDAPLAERFETLAEALRGAGYRTRAVTAARFLTPQYGTAQGFDHFHYFQGDTDQERAREFEVNIERAFEALEEMAEEPFFLFFHTYETHAPYRLREPWFQRVHGVPPPEEAKLRSHTARPGDGPPDADLGEAPGDTPGEKPSEPGQPFGVPKLRQQGGEELAGLSSDLYDASIAYMDDGIGELIARVEALGPAMIILTSDHGEMLGEHGLAGHAYLYEENLRVPLIAATPDGLGAGMRVEDQVRSVDIVPTILDLLGLPLKPNLDGRSLRAYMEGRRPAETPRAWSYASRTNQGFGFRANNRLKVTYDNSVWSEDAIRGQAFDLRNDPAEENPLPPPPEALELMQQRFASLSGLWLTLENPGDQSFTLEIQGSLVTPASFKSVALGDAVMSQPETEKARIELPAGGRTELRVEVVPQGDVSVSALADGASFRWDPTEIEEETWTWRQGQWQPMATDAPASGPTFRAAWVGERRAADRAVSQEDQALKEELRALGYID